MDIENMETLLKALSERTRLRIMALLTEGELRVCDLMAALNMPQSTVSRHLSYLKSARWIQSRRKGYWIYYRLVRGESALQQKLWSMLDKYPSVPMMLRHGPLENLNKGGKVAIP